MKNCLVVLGMHRSGTSAFTGILDILGVNLGTTMLETQSDNPKGFFENKYVVLANDCILETLNTSWDDTFPLPTNWLGRFDGSQLREDIRHFLRTDMTENQLSALKDPRLSRLLPLWLPLFTDENVSPHFALIIRNPLEIAESLAERNDFSIEKSFILWMQHMLDAERNTRELPRAFVKFESLLTNPRQSVESVFASTGLSTPNFSDEHSDELAQFLDRNMRHHEVSNEELEAICPPIIANYYRLLCKISDSGVTQQEDILELDQLGDQFQATQALFYNSDVVQSVTADKETRTPRLVQRRLETHQGGV